MPMHLQLTKLKVMRSKKTRSKNEVQIEFLKIKQLFWLNDTVPNLPTCKLVGTRKRSLETEGFML